MKKVIGMGWMAAAVVAGASEFKPMNVLMICVDDLRPELNCFGASHIQSPNMDRLAAKGRAFNRHYVNAPSCGPSRYTMLTGRYGPAKNEALFQRAELVKKNPAEIPPSMPEWFRMHGYTTVSVGKVSHNPGGLGGADWNDPNVLEVPNAWDKHLMPVAEWEHPRGAMHGLAHGKIRVKSKDHDVFESAEGADMNYPDGHIAGEGLKQLGELAAQEKPFFLAIGLIKPHLPFGAPKKYLDLYDGVEFPPTPHPTRPNGRTTWHKSGEFMRYNLWGKDPCMDQQFATEVRRHYAACVSYADKHVGDILAKLEETGEADNTIVILWGDHGWNLGEHAIWGKHNLFEEGVRSPLIVYAPDMKQPGVQTDAVVETLDIFPTICDLIGVDVPAFAQGISLIEQLAHPEAVGHSAASYWNGSKTLRTTRYRLTLHKDGSAELYDHDISSEEIQNIAAQQPDLVAELTQQLNAKLIIK